MPRCWHRLLNQYSMDRNSVDMAYPTRRGIRILFMLSCCAIPHAHREIASCLHG
jgi:hypothetical protein